MKRFLFVVVLFAGLSCIDSPPSNNNANNQNNSNNETNNVTGCESSSDCPTVPNGETECVNSTCSVSCVNGFIDENKSFEDGCECENMPEVCDGEDNDCNGSIDDIVTVCPTFGVCENQRSLCSDGTATCLFPPQYVDHPDEAWRCNGLDDNCDGTIDNLCCQSAGAIQISTAVTSATPPIILPSNSPGSLFTVVFFTEDPVRLNVAEIDREGDFTVNSTELFRPATGFYASATNTGTETVIAYKVDRDIYFVTWDGESFTENGVAAHTAALGLVVGRLALASAGADLQLAWTEIENGTISNLRTANDPLNGITPVDVETSTNTWLDVSTSQSQEIVVGYRSNGRVKIKTLPNQTDIGTSADTVPINGQFSLVDLGGNWTSVLRNLTSNDLKIETFETNAITTQTLPDSGAGAFAIDVDHDLDGVTDGILGLFEDAQSGGMVVFTFTVNDGIRLRTEAFSTSADMGFGISGARVDSRVGVLFRNGSNLEFYPMSQDGQPICLP